MSAYDPTKAFTVPGRFVIGPTQNGLSTGTYPYGGLALGICSRAKLVVEQQTAYAHSEALGRNKVGAYRGAFAAAISAVLVQFDKTLLNLLFAASSTSTGSYQGANVLSLPLPGRSITPGRVTSPTPTGANNAALLFAADDYLNQPSLIAYAPLWILEAKTMLDLTLKDPLETSFVAVLGCDSTNRDFQLDLIGHLSV